MAPSVKQFIRCVAIGIAAVAMASLVCLIAPPVRERPFAVFLAAVAVSLLYGGRRAGWLATGLSVAALSYLLITPLDRALVDRPTDLMQMVVFIGISLLLVALQDSRLRAEARLRRSNVELEQRVAERTGELSAANAELREQVSQRLRVEDSLHRIEWLLGRYVHAEAEIAPYEQQPYGDLSQLNTRRVLKDAIPDGALRGIVGDYLALLDSSAAVYEANGDYALGIYTSGWCRCMDAASRRLCGTDDNAEALRSGRWLCHEACWSTSRESIETRGPVDRDCPGGIRIYAVPVEADAEIVGSINFGYGDPPRDPARLQELSSRFGVPVDELRRLAESHETRPPYMIDLAKNRLKTSARLMGTIVELRRAQEEVRQLNAGLEQRVAARTAQLQAANQELEAFAYSVSHDLRAPLRAIDGFSKIIQKSHAPLLPVDGQRHLQLIREAAQRMGRLIDDLLDFSRMGRQEVHVKTVQTAELVQRCIQECRPTAEGRALEFVVGELPPCLADPPMLRQVWLNLISNAIKFTSKRDQGRIEIGCRTEGGEPVFYVRDNGVGFDMQYVGKLFGVFQRLHRMEDFDGTGVGLAIVRRVVHRHGGRVWAEAKPNEGATFHFTLGRQSETITERGEASGANLP